VDRVDSLLTKSLNHARHRRRRSEVKTPIGTHRRVAEYAHAEQPRSERDCGAAPKDADEEPAAERSRGDIDRKQVSRFGKIRPRYREGERWCRHEKGRESKRRAALRQRLAAEYCPCSHSQEREEPTRRQEWAARCEVVAPGRSKPVHFRQSLP